jgi:triacylglycerol lipase
MNLPAALDVAIGLVVLYLILSTLCSFTVELLAVWCWWRKRLLYETIARLVTGRSDCKAPRAPLLPRWSKEGHPGEMTRRFWNHRLALSLSPDKQIPSYVEPSTFAAIVVDLAVPGAAEGTLPETAEGLQRVIELAAKSGEESLRPLRENLLSIYRTRDLTRPANQPAATPLEDLRSGVERWYNEAMDRLSGQYKRIVQRWLLALGFIVAAVFNADTIRAIHMLSSNESLRNTVATYGATLVTSTNAAVAPEVSTLLSTNNLEVLELRTNLVGQLKEFQKLQAVGFPVGWKGGNQFSVNFVPYDRMKGFWIFLIKLAGLAATACAISLGAPFWFDLLNKLVSLRSTGKRVETDSADHSSGTAPVDSASATTTLDSGAVQALAVDPVTAPPAGDIAKDMADGRMGFNVRKAYWCAEAALLAYANEESVRSTAEKQWSLKLVYMFEKVEAAQGFLAVGDGFAVLAFRGTEKKLEDWQTDIAFELTAKPSVYDKCETHKGFSDDLEKVYADIKTELAKNIGKDTLLYVTGHSLGAALATLMAARLTAEKQKVCGVHAVYTFGSPRVGDPAFATAYTYALGNSTYRVINAEDLVTRVPPRIVPTKPQWHYDHVGQIVYFDTDGRMQLNAGFWERFLNTLINAVQDFRNEIKTCIKDHSMEGYVRLLKKQLGG